MQVISRRDMFECDRFTIEVFGVAGSILMEVAGKGCYDEIKSVLDSIGKRKSHYTAVLCGSGNNGGDGFVVARWLILSGYRVTVFVVDEISKMSAETALNYNLLIKMEAEIHQLNNFTEFENTFKEINSTEQVRFNVIIDAIFGIGFKGCLKNWKADLIEYLNSFNALKISLDIPSGLDSQTGNGNAIFKADFTLTIAALKYGMLLNKGREKCGDIRLIPIGIPWKLVDEKIRKKYLITKPLYPKRKIFSHKTDYGKIAVIAGSKGLTGAAIMACQAALKSGGGLITLFHENDVYLGSIFETNLTEVMTKTIPSEMEDLDKELQFYDVLLVGPGWGVSKSNLEILKHIAVNWEKPLVLDADALNIISQNNSILKHLKGKNVLLTPHIGEFSRLIKLEKKIIIEDKIKYLTDFVSEYEISVLLKDFTTIFADKDYLIFDTTGNDGLSTGGSGDILAGIIVSFLGQKMSLKDSATSASYILGKTAEKLAFQLETMAITPTDIIKNMFIK